MFVGVSELGDALRFVDSQADSVFRGYGGGDVDCAVFTDCKKSPIKRGIKMRSQEESVPDVEPLGVGFAVGPGLYVTGSQQLRNRKSSHGTAAFPELEQSLAKHILADALHDETLNFGFARQTLCLA